MGISFVGQNLRARNAVEGEEENGVPGRSTGL
jgi:hypothetical protein